MIYIFSNKNRCKFFFALILLLTLFLFFRLQLLLYFRLLHEHETTNFGDCNHKNCGN